MKATNKNIESFVRRQLATNPIWAVKAMVRIFKENQTEQEQAVHATNQLNGIGFTGIDANILSSFSEQYEKRGTLSPKQTQLVLKMMPKYAKQVIAFSDKEKLIGMVEKLSPLKNNS